MVLLDHNIPQQEAEHLRRWRIHFRQIGYEVGRPEWDDQQEILRYLHRIKQPTFFTRDLGFFKARLCHPNYCLVVVTGSVMDTASLIRRMLRHPEFKTKNKRRGKVLRLSSTNIAWWEIDKERQCHLLW